MHDPDTKYVYHGAHNDTFKLHPSGNYTISHRTFNSATIVRRPGTFQYASFGHHITSLHFWMAQLVGYVTRPNDLTAGVVSTTIRTTFPGGIIPPNMATVFIRRGDKSIEMPLDSVENHLELIPAGVTDVFLGSDSQQAIAEAIEKGGSRFKFHVIDGRRNGAGSVFSEENAQRWFTPEIVEHTKVLLAGLYISAMGGVMVGQLGSNWARLMHEIHDVKGAAHMPFHSPGVCDRDKELLVFGTMTLYNKAAHKLGRVLWTLWTRQTLQQAKERFGPVWEEWCEGS